MHGNVTLGISCYRQAGLVTSLVESLLPTLLPGDEVLIADDGSGDAEVAVLRLLCERFEVVRLIEGVPTGRAASNRNRLIASARGDFLVSVDGDDALQPGWRDALSDALSIVPDADVVFFDYEIVAPKRDDTHSSALRARGLYDKLLVLRRGGTGDIHDLDARALQRLALAYASPLHTVNCIARRETLLSLGLSWDDRFRVAEDTDFFVRLLRCPRVVYVDRTLGQYRIGEQGLTRTARLESDLARVVQRQSMFLEAARSGHLDDSLWLHLTGRTAEAELALAYNLRTYGEPRKARAMVLRALATGIDRTKVVELAKSFAAQLMSPKRLDSSPHYWQHTGRADEPSRGKGE
jgi:glycosyltransferase involved in cell wall biosynthesis